MDVISMSIYNLDLRSRPGLLPSEVLHTPEVLQNLPISIRKLVENDIKVSFKGISIVK